MPKREKLKPKSTREPLKLCIYGYITKARTVLNK